MLADRGCHRVIPVCCYIVPDSLLDYKSFLAFLKASQKFGHDKHTHFAEAPQTGFCRLTKRLEYDIKLDVVDVRGLSDP
jgi:hypothetical protein